MQIVPLRFCHTGTKKSVLWPSKYAKIRFRSGLCPGRRWGSSWFSPRTPSRLGRGHSPHTSHSAPTHLWRLPCVPPEFQPDLRQAMGVHTVFSTFLFRQSFPDIVLWGFDHTTPSWCMQLFRYFSHDKHFITDIDTDTRFHLCCGPESCFGTELCETCRCNFLITGLHAPSFTTVHNLLPDHV